MYKVFFDDRLLFLTDKQKNQLGFDFDVFEQFSTLANLEKTILSFENETDKKVVVISHTDVHMLKNYVQSFFQLVKAAGGLVLNNEGKLLIIKRYNKWDLPKGKIDRGENPQEAALREVKEECGIHGMEMEKNEKAVCTFHLYRLKNKKVLKKTYWFRMFYPGNEIPVPQTEEDISLACWIEKDEIPDILNNTYLSLKDLFTHVFDKPKTGKSNY